MAAVAPHGRARGGASARSTAARPASGANRDVEVDGDLRHAQRRGCCAATPAGWATRSPPEVVRGTILVRLAQMAAGGGGHRPEVADALIARRCATSALPELRDLGGLGTGDLTRARRSSASRSPTAAGWRSRPATRCR